MRRSTRPVPSPRPALDGEPDAVPEVVTEASAGPVDDVPSDWHGLWARMVDQRTGRNPVAQAPLAWRPATGWQIKGPISARSAALFDLYKPLLDARSASASAWTVAQMGQSLDGFVATATGDSYYVNGAHSLLHLHRLRALCDAVVVGAGTVAIDNPQLTTRRVPGPNPVRVVIDPAARLDGTSRVFTDGQAPTVWLCDAHHADAARARLASNAAHGGEPVDVVAVSGLLLDTGSGYRANMAVAALAERGLRVLFVEGGGITVSRFFGAGALDRLHLAVAPVLIGNGRRGLQVPAHDAMTDCPRPPARMVVLGDDMLWDLDLQAMRADA